MTGSSRAMSPVPPILVTGATNFRELRDMRALDGRSVRPGALLRSDRLCELSARDWRILGELPLVTICDLRSAAERRRHPNTVPATLRVCSLEFETDHDLGVNRSLIELLSRDPTPAGAVRVMVGLYRRFPTEMAPALRAIVACLIAGGSPMLIHCTAGKDRTGFVVGALLRALEIAPAAVEADYLMSRGWSGARRYRAALWRRLAPDIPAAQLQPILDAVLDVRRAYLRAAFSIISAQFGSFGRYLQTGVGISGADVAQLREVMLQ